MAHPLRAVAGRGRRQRALVREIGRTYLPDGNSFRRPTSKLLEPSPVVSAVMGSVAGLPAVNACMAHFNVMVKGTSQLFPGGPPVVKAALGYDITKEDLGGDRHPRDDQRRGRQPRRDGGGRARR